MTDSWTIQTLGDVCEMYQPKTISQKHMDPNGKYPVYGANGIIGRYKEYNHEASQLLITCRGATCGAVNISQPYSWINGNAMVVRPKHENLMVEYLRYFFIGGIDISQVISGAAQPQITRKSLSPVKLQVPPLPEQKRIVAILDEAFEAIDQARANVERNLENAKELFRSKLNAIFSQKGEGWAEKKLGDFAEFRNGLNFKKSSKGETIKLVGVSDFQDNFYVPIDTLESVTIDGTLNVSDLLKNGDIVTVRSNGNPELIGRCMLAEDVVEKTSHSGFAIRIRLTDDTFWPPYLCQYLKSSKARRDLINSGTGISIKSLNQGSLSSLIIPLPPTIEVQKQVFYYISELSTLTKKLETNYMLRLDGIKELKKSILQKAFNGEL